MGTYFPFEPIVGIALLSPSFPKMPTIGESQEYSGTCHLHACEYVSLAKGSLSWFVKPFCTHLFYISIYYMSKSSVTIV